jgi:hypothetical protein
MAKPRTIYMYGELKAPPEYAFDAIAHADALARLPGVRKVDEQTAGDPAPYGVGAYRIVDLGAILLEEETVHYDRPRQLKYVIRRGRPAFTHEGGEYNVEPTANGGSRVRWKSTLAVDAPLVGPVLTFLLAAGMRRGLQGTLAAIDKNYAKGV